MRHLSDLSLPCALLVTVACSGDLSAPTSGTPGDPTAGTGTLGAPGSGTPGGGTLGDGTPGGVVPGSGDPLAPGVQPTGPAAPDGVGSNSPEPSGSPGPGAGSGGTATTDPDIVEALGNGEPLPLSLEEGAPIFARTVRLTHEQWERSVSSLLAMPGGTGQRAGLTDDAAATSDFSNNEDLLYVTGTLWADYANAASALAAQVAGDPTALAAINSGEDGAEFVRTFGRRAFRRPLTDEETANYQAIYDVGASLSEGGATEFARGAGMVIEAMLQSPHFLYRVELTPAGERLTGYEVAAKLSLLLRGVTPDDALLDMAERGELDSDASIVPLAETMMAEPTFAQVMREYHGEMFRLPRFLQIEKDPISVPEYSSVLGEELQESAYLFFDRIVMQGLGVRDILLSDTGYVGPRMAEFYDVPAPASGFSEVTMPAERPGYFTQLPFLILNSVNLVPDSIHRGVSLNLEVLCAEVPPPPPAAADATLPSAKADETNRERVDGATGDGTCGATCHAVYINPLGFAFENFDGLGRLRDMDNGESIDTSGDYPFVEGELTFDGAPQLMQLMADGEQVHQCYAKHLAGYALQRDLDPSDQSLLDTLTTYSQSSGSSVRQMMLDLVSNPAFTTRPTGGAQ